MSGSELLKKLIGMKLGNCSYSDFNVLVAILTLDIHNLKKKMLFLNPTFYKECGDCLPRFGFTAGAS